MSNYYKINRYDTGNGPGLRTTVFLCGCEHYCKNCFNKILWDFNIGVEFNDEAIENILKTIDSHTMGLSILGGEPLHPNNIEATYNLCKKFKERFPQKNIWLWTGYKFEEIVNYSKVIELIDVIIDGKFIEELKDLRLKWRGSSNQRIINVSQTLKNNEIILLDL